MIPWARRCRTDASVVAESGSGTFDLCFPLGLQWDADAATKFIVKWRILAFALLLPVGSLGQELWGGPHCGMTVDELRQRTPHLSPLSNDEISMGRPKDLRHLRPELIGRLVKLNDTHGGLLCFCRLEEPEQRGLLGFHLEQDLARMRALGQEITVTPGAFEHLVRRGFNEDYGARRLLGIINDSIEGAIATALRAGLPACDALVEAPDSVNLCRRA